MISNESAKSASRRWGDSIQPRWKDNKGAAMIDCLKCFWDFRIDPSDGLSHQILRLTFDNLKVYFLTWAQAASRSALPPKILDSIRATMSKIKSMLLDEDRLEEEYGLLKIYEDRVLNGYSESQLGGPFSASVHSILSALDDCYFPQSLKVWTVIDEAKYLTFLQLLKELINDLVLSTGNGWTLQEQRSHVTEIMATLASSDLELVKATGLDTHDLIADAAASQLKRRADKAKPQVNSDSQPLSHESSENSKASHGSEVDSLSEFTDSVAILTPQSSIVAPGLQSRFETLVEMSMQSHGELLRRNYPIDRLAQRRIVTEIRRSHAAPPYTSLSFINSSISDLLGIIAGPPDSPYEGGIFFLQFRIPNGYPLQPPKCRFVTRVYHPNVGMNGEICMNVLMKTQWNPVWSLWDLLLAMMIILDEPNEKDFLVQEVAHVLKANRKQFEENASEWTKRYATGEWPEPGMLEWKN